MPDNYTIIENTPGYLPESDDPPMFDSYAEALNDLVQYNKELREAIHEELKVPCWVVSPIVNGFFDYVDALDFRALERVVEIVPLEQED